MAALRVRVLLDPDDPKFETLFHAVDALVGAKLQYMSEDAFAEHAADVERASYGLTRAITDLVAKVE